MDATGQPLMDLIVWMDHRGLSQVERLQSLVGSERYYRISGHPIVPITGVSKVLWLQQEAPEIWQRTHSIGPPQTLFLRWLGCQESLVDFSSGSYLFPCDIRARQWSEEIAGLLAFPLEKLPRLVPATEIVGRTQRNRREAAGTPGRDAACGRWGRRTVRRGRHRCGAARKRDGQRRHGHRRPGVLGRADLRPVEHAQLRGTRGSRRLGDGGTHPGLRHGLPLVARRVRRRGDGARRPAPGRMPTACWSSRPAWSLQAVMG